MPTSYGESADLPVEIRWLDPAGDELYEIAAYIAIDSPNAAARLLRRIEHKVLLLADQPRLGPRRDDLRAGARMLIEEPYVILYRAVPDIKDDPVDFVEIVDVIDGRRDLGRVLARRPR